MLGVNQITAYWGWSEIGEDAYRQYNDYMGRLARLLTGGEQCCDVAVLYPVRSAWAQYVPLDRPFRWGEEATRKPMTAPASPASIPRWCATCCAARSTWTSWTRRRSDSGEIADGALRVGGERYRAIVLPPLYALGSEAARALAAFARAGGVLIGAGPLPDLAESAEATQSCARKFCRCSAQTGRRAWSARLNWRRPAVALPPDLALTEANRDILYTHRQLEGRDLYFVINNSPNPATIRPALRVPGPYTLYRPLTGTVDPVGMPLDLALDGYEGVFVVADGTAQCDHRFRSPTPPTPGTGLGSAAHKT